MQEFARNASAIGEVLFGVGVNELSTYHMIARALVVFTVALVAIRLGDKRFMGKNTSFDLMVAIMFGSIAGRGITGNSPFYATLVTCCTLVALHWLTSSLAFRSDRVGAFVKGRRTRLVKDGVRDEEAMRSTHITERDLRQALRLSGHKDDIDAIEHAYLERNGEISIVCADDDDGDDECKRD